MTAAARLHVGARTLEGLLFAASILLSSCAPRVDPRFAREADGAEAEYLAGRYAAAGERWLVAARAASSAVDRDEATYRAASSFARAGDEPRAEALLATLASGHGERAARASFDRARLVGEHDRKRGAALRLEALRSHPNSGVADQALREHLADLEADEGAPAALTACRALETELASTELDGALGYECARRTEQSGDFARARDEYLTSAARHPYPDGAYWDDALAGASRCEERLGQPGRAVALLERMLDQREHAVAIGSYERSRYAEARFHVAELYRDALGDPERARREFRRVFDEHTTSQLRDDALFEEARVASRENDAKGACEALRLLARELPDSRFAGCAPLYCEGATATSRPCPSHLP